jgi:16S rRNA A1518/A1519 N6-dimethyltransferase RsmA/KsgA/DIM1 with predicted DNA glycosylase/AP lyase activity
LDAPGKAGIICANDPYTVYSFYILQVLQLKKDNPGVLLMVEVGYKLKFFGDDAKVSCRISPGAQLHAQAAIFRLHRLSLALPAFPIATLSKL